MSEMAWREDNCRMSNVEQTRRVAALALANCHTLAFCRSPTFRTLAHPSRNAFVRYSPDGRIATLRTWLR